MASNQHAYLSEANLHNPKGLSLASQNTLCSKNSASELEWVEKSFIKTDKVTLSGFCTLTANYQYPNSFNAENKAPYSIAYDYGSPTISSGTTVAAKFFFRAGGFMSCQDGIANRCVIQVTNDASGDPFTVALVKYTPNALSTTAYPVVLHEQIVNGSSNNNEIISYTIIPETTFTNTAISTGDHIFLMIKSNGETGVGDDVFVTLNLEIGYSE